MQIKIRNNVFETNSSSMHSFSMVDNMKDSFFTKEEAIEDLENSKETFSENVIEDGILYYDRIIDDCKEFGWGPDVFNDFTHKFCYAVITLYCNDECIKDKTSPFNQFLDYFKEFLGIKDIVFSKVKDPYDKSCTINPGSIDHQSQGELEPALFESHTTMIDFVLNRKYLLIIDNDNH